jgi:outer membrane receptor protein involved in Fe transport
VELAQGEPGDVNNGYSISIGNGKPYGEYDSWIVSLNMEWDIGSFTVSSVTGYFDYEYERWDNFDGTNYIQLMGIQVEDQTTWSQEIRLMSNFDSPVNFMVGGFYETFERDSDNAGKIFPVGPDPTTGFTNNWEGASTVNSDSYSFFGQVTWDINEAWELAAGARYTNDDRDMEESNVYVHDGLGAFFLAEGTVIKSDFDDDNVSPEVTLSWRPTDTMTLWTAYRSGYKAGGFSTQTVLPPDTNSENVKFDPEEAEGVEAGIKSTWMDGRLRVNANIYYYEADDLQVSAFNAETTSFRINNAASSETTGIEVETDFMVVDGLLLRVQFGYNEAEYDDFTTSACYSGQTPAQGCDPDTQTQDLSGENLTRAPEWSGSLGFDFNREITGRLGLQIAGEAVFTDDYQTNTNNNPLSIQESFWRYNARAALYSTDGRWDVSVIGRNLSEEWYIAGQADKPGGFPGGDDLFGGVLRGRQVILQAAVHF